MSPMPDGDEAAAFLEHLDRIEEKVTRLLDQAAALQSENLELKRRIGHLEEELNRKRAAETRWAEERAQIRARIDHVLARLEGVHRS